MALTREQALRAASVLTLAFGMNTGGAKKVSTPAGSAFYHLPIGALIVAHGKATMTTGAAAQPSGQAGHIGPHQKGGMPPEPKAVPHGWIPEPKWLEGQAEWEAIWKANEWKGHGSKHIWASGHMFSVPDDADVFVSKDVDVTKDHDVAEAAKYVVIGKPGEGKAAKLLPSGQFEEVTLNDHLMDLLKQNGTQLPDAGTQHLPVKVGSAQHWIPQDWHAYTIPGSKKNAGVVYAKAPDGTWHRIDEQGHKPFKNEQSMANMDSLLDAGKLQPYAHPLVHAEHQPPPAEPQAEGVIAGKTLISGIEVSYDQVQEALNLLNNDGSTQVKLPLKHAGHPLQAMDYHALAKQELKDYPEVKLAKGSKQAHVGQVKYAILHYLARVLEEQPKDDAAGKLAADTIDKTEEAAQTSEELAPATVKLGTVSTSPLKSIAAEFIIHHAEKEKEEPDWQKKVEDLLPHDSKTDAAVESATQNVHDSGLSEDENPAAFWKEVYQQAVEALAQEAKEAKEEPAASPEDFESEADKAIPADSGPKSVGGVLVSKDDIQGAIDALEAHPNSTAIKQILKGAGNKLQNTDYWAVIHQFEADTGKKAKGKAREQFIAALKSYLGEAKAADTQSLTDVTQLLHTVVDEGTVVHTSQGPAAQMIAKALMSAKASGQTLYVGKSETHPGEWVTSAFGIPNPGDSHYIVTPDLHVKHSGGTEFTASQVLIMANHWLLPGDSALAQTVKQALKDFHAMKSKDLGLPKDKTIPVILYSSASTEGKTAAQVPEGSKIYVIAEPHTPGILPVQAWAQYPDGAWYYIGLQGKAEPVEGVDIQSYVDDGTVTEAGPDGKPKPKEPAQPQSTAETVSAQYQHMLGVAKNKAEDTKGWGPGKPLSYKLAQAIATVNGDIHGAENEETWVTLEPDGQGWNYSPSQPFPHSDAPYYHVKKAPFSKKVQVRFGPGGAAAEGAMGLDDVLEILNGKAHWEDGNTDYAVKEEPPAPEPSKPAPTDIGVPEPKPSPPEPTPAGKPAPPEEPEKAPSIPVIVSGQLAKDGAPAGSVLYKELPSYAGAYVDSDPKAKAPDGKWYDVTLYGTHKVGYGNYDEKLAKGLLEELPPASEQDIKDLQTAQKYVKLLDNGAVDLVAGDGTWEQAAVAYLAGGTGSGHYGSTAFVHKEDGKWKGVGYSSWAKGEHYKIDLKTLEIMHYPGTGEDNGTKIPLSVITAAVDKYLVKDAVLIGGKVKAFGYYSSPKGKGTYLEVKSAGDSTYGYNATYKYGAAAKATYIWHKSDGTNKLVTPTYAAKVMENATEFSSQDPPSYTPKSAVAKTPSKYASVLTAAGGKFQTVDGNALTVLPDGSATLKQQYYPYGEEQVHNVSDLMSKGQILDQFHNSVLEPGTTPSKVHVFGKEMDYPKVAEFEAEFQAAYDDQKALKDVLKKYGPFGSLTKGFSQAKIGDVYNWEQQRDAILGLLKDLQEIPGADPALFAKADVPEHEVKFLKGLPEGISEAKDVFQFNAAGQAHPLDEVLPVPQMLAYENATELAAIIKTISAQYGGGKVVGTHPAALAKDAKLDWVRSWLDGDMQKVFAYDAHGGKVSPAHPGAPENTATHQITWAPWQDGQVPAGEGNVEGNWSDFKKVTLPIAEVHNYLIAMHLQHAEYLSPSEQRALVKHHRQGEQWGVDNLTKLAWKLWSNHGNPVTEPLKWTDNIQPAKSYDSFLEDKTAAPSWPAHAVSDFLDDHPAEISPYMDQVNDGWTGTLSGQSYYYKQQALQLYLDHLAAVELAEKLKPRYHWVEQGHTISDQHGHKFYFHEGKDAARYAGITRLARTFGFKTPAASQVKLETGESGEAVELLDGTSVTDDAVTKLGSRQISDIAAEHVLDWALDNPYGDASKFILTPSSAVVGTDKSGAFEWRLGPQSGEGQGFFNDALGHVHWGWHGGAGLLVQHTDEHGVTRYLLQKRSGTVMNAGTWSTPGGAIDIDPQTGKPETPDVAALRETTEEWGELPGSLAMLQVDTIHHGEEGKEGHWSYSTVHASVPEQFTPAGGEGEHGEESAGFKWVTLKEMEKLKLQPGFAETAKKLGANIDLAKVEPPGRWNLMGRVAPDFYSQRLDTRLYEAIAAGQITQEAADQAYVNAIRTARRMAQLPDDRMRSILQDAFANVSEHPRIQSIIARKNWLEPSFQQLWTGLYRKAGWTLPEVPAERLSHGLHSGFSEPVFFDHVMAARSKGVPAFFAGTELEDGHFLVWTEMAGDNRLINGEAGLRGEALDKAVAWAEQHEAGAAQVNNLLPPAKSKQWYDTILLAAKAVSRHAHDGMYSGAFTKEKLGHMTGVKVTLSAALKGAEDAIQAGEDSPEWKVFLTQKLGDPRVVQHAAKHYLNLIGKVETAREEHGSFKPGDLPQWHMPVWLKKKLPEEPAFKVEKLTAYRTLGKNQKLTSLAEYGKDPTAGQAILGDDGELHLGDQTYPYPGQAWYITLPTGEVIELNDESKTMTPLAQQGRVRFRALASDGSVSLERIRAHLQEMGLTLNEAEQHDMELSYWRILTHTLADRKDRKTGKLGQIWFGLSAAGSEHNIPGAQPAVTSAEPEALHKAVAAITSAGLSPEEELGIWHQIWAPWTSKEQIEEWSEQRRYLPHLGHFDPMRPEVTGGKPHWYRHDATPEFVSGLKMPAHSLGYKQKEGDPAQHIIRTGLLGSTEARLRALGIWRPGKSSVSDMEKGSSGTVFVRLNQEMAGANILLHPRVLAQLHTYGFNGDHFGAIADRPTNSYFDLAKAAGFSGSSNETDIKDAVSFVDDIEMITAEPALRESLIAEFKAAGISEIRGVPIENRIVNAITSAAVASAHERISAEGDAMLRHPEQVYVPPPSEHVAAENSAVTTKAEQQAYDASIADAGKSTVLAEHDQAASPEAVAGVYSGSGKYPEVGKASQSQAAQAKMEVASRVAQAMTSTDDQLQALSTAAGLFVPGYMQGSEKEKLVGTLVKTWATSHNSAIAQALKLRAHELFGLAKPVWNLPDMTANTEAEAKALMDGYGGVIDDFLKAMWTLTQQDMSSSGITHVTLYRIMRFSGPLPGWAAGHQAGDKVGTPQTLALSSWAFTQQAATSAGTFGPGKSSGATEVIVKATVPRELLLSFPRTGFGAYNEGEFVVLDSAGQWEIIKVG